MRHSIRVLAVVFAVAFGSGISRAATVPSGFSETLISNGFFSPTGMDFAADGRLFVGEQKGRIRVMRNDTLLATPVMNLQLKTDYNTERGLQGLVLDPNFLVNGYLYVFYTAKGSTTTTSRNRLSRFTVVNNLADTAQETILFELPTLPTRPGGNFTNQNVGSGTTNQAVWHMGGALAFGNDGKIYVGVGEHEVTSTSQSMTSLFGKMLRLNPDGSIPTDNPFYNTATAEYRAIYATGMRNPYTMAVQRSTGRLYVADVGDVTWEEIDTIAAGGNHGWGTCEGNFNTGSTTTNCGVSNHVRPLFSYRHYSNNATAQGNCVVAGDFAGGSFGSQNNGQFFFGDFPNTNVQTRGWIKRINPATGGDTATFATGVSGITGLKFSPVNGALYYITRGSSTGTIDTVDVTKGKLLKIRNVATPVIPSARTRDGSALLAVMGRRTLAVPSGVTGIEIFELSGRRVWSATNLKSGGTLEIPLSQPGVLKYRWTIGR